MKKAHLVIIVILFCTVNSLSAQVQYHATKVATGKWDESKQKFVKGPFRPVATKTIINLFNNAITIRGDRDFSLKFVRKVQMTNEDGTSQPQWTAVDLTGEDPCTVTVIDYGTYSKVAFHWIESNVLLVYQTL
jgi:hypothetical protein